MAIKGLFTTSLITPNQGGRVSTGPAPTPEGAARTARDFERVQLSRPGLGGLLLIGIVLGSGSGLAWWKHTAIAERNAASLSQPEPMELVTASVALRARAHADDDVDRDGPCAASITLNNEFAGTVRELWLVPGRNRRRGKSPRRARRLRGGRRAESEEAQAAPETSLDRRQRAPARGPSRRWT